MNISKKDFVRKIKRFFGTNSVNEDAAEIIAEQHSSTRTQIRKNNSIEERQTSPPTQTTQSPMRDQSKPNKKIEWLTTPSTKEQLPSDKGTPKKVKEVDKGLDWGGSKGVSIIDNLIGVEDALDHTPIRAGEKIAYCERDKVAYHFSTWEFLKNENQGKCCICGLPNYIKIITLPGTPKPDVIPVKHKPPKVEVLQGEKIISHEDVHNHIGKMVIVQGYVYEAYRTKNTGTYFVRFEPRRYNDPPFKGFTVVIFPKYQPFWTAIGIDIKSYEHKMIRVRGIVNNHSKWDIGILVNSPNVIEIIDNE